MHVHDKLQNNLLKIIWKKLNIFNNVPLWLKIKNVLYYLDINDAFW